MFYNKKLPRPHDRLRSQINWNTCILLIAISIAVVVIILIELHIRRVATHSGLPGSAISLSPRALEVGGFSATLVSLLSESNV
jgi:ABC-type uncharacterized transport system permease subunit